ncbi:PAS domain-containing protein [Cohnella thermotolerans]|uniref:PAS domain-containing protein n=1 Tax=Cohnella thermotolerans TaxID=329858 RepID=UPI00040446B8|nr:PAS domain-containing protein [Cohnella thermotolerans]
MKTLHFLEQKGILDEIPMGIVILDPFECIIEINQYACEVLQCRKEEVIRRLWSNKFPSVCPPDSSPGNEGQSFVNFKCGNENYVLKKHPFYGKGKQAGFVLLFQKTTELEQLTQALDSYRDMSRFASHLRHFLRCDLCLGRQRDYAESKFGLREALGA